MNRPRLTRNELENKIRSLRVPEPVKLVGIRGYYKDTMGKPGENDRGIYDDAIFLIGPTVFFAFNANTDPSIFRAGIAKLMPGIHYYKKGKHGLSRPGGGYDALRPDTPGETLPVTRDGLEGTKLGVAINIHKGSYNSTSSEGCQTIHPDQWIQFINEVYRAMDHEGQKRIPYILIEQ
jgi:lysozyme